MNILYSLLYFAVQGVEFQEYPIILNDTYIYTYTVFVWVYVHTDRYVCFTLKLYSTYIHMYTYIYIHTQFFQLPVWKSDSCVLSRPGLAPAKGVPPQRRGTLAGSRGHDGSRYPPQVEMRVHRGCKFLGVPRHDQVTLEECSIHLGLTRSSIHFKASRSDNLWCFLESPPATDYSCLGPTCSIGA